MLAQICSGQGVAGVITSIADITTTLIFSDGKFSTLTGMSGSLLIVLSI